MLVGLSIWVLSGFGLYWTISGLVANPVIWPNPLRSSQITNEISLDLIEMSLDLIKNSPDLDKISRNLVGFQVILR